MCIRCIFLALLTLELCIAAGSAQATDDYSTQSVHVVGHMVGAGDKEAWGWVGCMRWGIEQHWQELYSSGDVAARCSCPPCCRTELGWRRTHLSVHLLDFGGRWKPTNSHCKPNGNPVSVTEDKNLLCLLLTLSKWYEGSSLLLFSGLKWATGTRKSLLEQELVFRCYWHKCPPHLTRISWLCHSVTPYYLRQRASCSHVKERITSASFSWSEML